MKVLVACEFSGTVRDAFARLGHDAWSCDLLPTEKPGNHYQGDVREILYEGWWDLLIAHPDCTYLTCSAEWAYGDGPYHQEVQPGTLTGAARRAAREEAAEFFLELYNAPIGMVAVENPVGCMSSRFRPADQYIQPYEFGADASKKTGLWLRGLPKLEPTLRIPGRIVEFPKGSGKMVERWSNQTDSGQNRLTPGENRWAIRSVTYPGIAAAMAHQWGTIQTVTPALRSIAA